MRILLLAAAAGIIASASASAQSFSFTTLDNPGDPTFNQLLGINDSGTIVGYFGSGASGHPNIGYKIAAPYTSYTQFLEPGSVQTQATGINNADTIVDFWSGTNFGPGQDANYGAVRQKLGKGFAYTSVVDPLTASAPATDQALGVNNSNVVAGFYVDGNNASHGFTYDTATATYTPINIGGAVSVAATGINDSGEVSGLYNTAKGATFGFVRNASGGVVTHFKVPGALITQLLGINNEGVAVGFYQQTMTSTPHGLYYKPATGAWISVDDPNAVGGTVVNGLNNKGQLVGFYTDAAGNVHGMLVNVTQ